MAILPRLTLALLAQGSSAPMPTEAVIVTDLPISADFRAKLDKMGVPDRIALYTKQRFARVDKGTRAYLFAPRLWAEKEFAEELAMWQEAADHVRPDGTIDLAAAPALAQGAGEVFTNAGYQGLAGANALLSQSVTLTLSAHGVTKTVRLGGAQTPEEQGKLQAKPMTRRPPDAPVPKPLQDVRGNFFVPDALCVLSPGPRVYSPVLRMQEIGEASGILAERYEKRREGVLKARSALQRKVVKFGFLSDVTPGTRASDLSSDAQWELNFQLVKNYQQMGFDNQDDAESFLRNARVDGATPVFTLMAAASGATGGQPNYYGFVLP